MLAQNISSLCPLYLKTDEKFIHHDFASSEVKRSGFSLALCKLKHDWSLAIKMLPVIKFFQNYLDWTLLLLNFCFKCKVQHIYFRCLFHCWIIRIKACLFGDVYILCLCCVHASCTCTCTLQESWLHICYPFEIILPNQNIELFLLSVKLNWIC